MHHHAPGIAPHVIEGMPHGVHTGDLRQRQAHRIQVGEGIIEQILMRFPDVQQHRCTGPDLVE